MQKNIHKNIQQKKLYCSDVMFDCLSMNDTRYYNCTDDLFPFYIPIIYEKKKFEKKERVHYHDVSINPIALQ